MMKTNNSAFELIPEESEVGGGVGGDAPAARDGVMVSKAGMTHEAAAAAAAVVSQAANNPNMPAAAVAQQAAAAAAAARILQVQQAAALAGPLLPDLALQQHMLQVKQQQLLQQQILEQQFQRNREILQEEHERQIGIILHQVEAQRKAKEAAAVEHERQEKLRLEFLKQKSRQEQSAVASPEVKRHLQEFVLQKKRKEAAVSMSNLKMVPTAGPVAPNHAILRKTASESNLLKMKPGKRNATAGCSSPYQRTSGIYHQPAIPEDNAVQGGSLQDSPVGSAESSASSSLSTAAGVPSGATRPLDLGVSLVRQQQGGQGGSAPTSPKTILAAAAAAAQQQQQQYGGHYGGHRHNANHPLLPPSAVDGLLRGATGGGVNSKSLPNIPSAVGRLVGKESFHKVGRKSPPAAHTTTSSLRPPPHHSAMLVRRSKSSAILPLRKHLIEKTLAEQQAAKTAMDEEQFYFQQKQKMAKDRLFIRPIEEVMEEDVVRSNGNANNASSADNVMDVDESPPPQRALAFAARLGTAGLSPLVLGEVTPTSAAAASNNSSVGSNEGLPQEYLSRLLPTQPIRGDLVASTTSLSAAQGERTGLGFDPVMLKHECVCNDARLHPENPRRLQCIWSHLVSTGLAEQCVRVSKAASLEEIRSVHSEPHTILYGAAAGSLSATTTAAKFSLLKCGGLGVDSDTYWSEQYTSVAARTAVGTVLELSTMVAHGELKNGFALVRPPGHHAEYEEAMGFCYFNSVAIAAKQLLATCPQVNRVLIIDWAIHHGNGTQQAFYDNPNVLYISLHRHDHGNFYPGTGGPVECGSGAGLGFNVNVAWAGGLDNPMADAEYLAAFRAVVLPIAKSFAPDIVLVSAGFDAAIGHPHPIGGYAVSTACFAFLTLQLRQLARGRVVLALEGGFNEEVLCTAAEQCVRALLGLPIDKIAEGELARRPNEAATETLQKTLAIQSPYWDVLRRHPEAALLSHLEAWEKEREQTETLSAMASLSMKHQQSISSQGSSCSIVDDVDVDASMA